MIICSCNVLTKRLVIEAASVLAAEEPGRPVTPGRLFKRLGARPQCGTCFATVRRIVADSGVEFTCPEPLASSAEEETVVEFFELTIVVDERD